MRARCGEFPPQALDPGKGWRSQPRRCQRVNRIGKPPFHSESCPWDLCSKTRCGRRVSPPPARAASLSDPPGVNSLATGPSSPLQTCRSQHARMHCRARRSSQDTDYCEPNCQRTPVQYSSNRCGRCRGRAAYRARLTACAPQPRSAFKLSQPQKQKPRTPCGSPGFLWLFGSGSWPTPSLPFPELPFRPIHADNPWSPDLTWARRGQSSTDWRSLVSSRTRRTIWTRPTVPQRYLRGACVLRLSVTYSLQFQKAFAPLFTWTQCEIALAPDGFYINSSISSTQFTRSNSACQEKR